MGRQVYFTRLALGRSAYEHPENSEHFDASRAGEWSSALIYTGIQSKTPIDFTESQPPPNVQLYDAKGHPFNPWSRRLGRRLREAMNDVLSVVGVVERSKPGYGVDGSAQNGSNGLLIHSEEDIAGQYLSDFAEVDYGIWTSWHSSFVMRLLAFPPLPGISYFDLLRDHCTALGMKNFFLSGFPSFLLNTVYTPESWSPTIFYYLDRAVFATVSSRRGRELYDQLLPYIDFVVQIVLTTLHFPFGLHANLQALGFIPATTLLPPLRSCVPFCGTSVLQFRRDHLQILPFVLARPLAWMVYKYISNCTRLSLMVPISIDGRRRSSASRRTMSVTSVNLLEITNFPHLGPFHALFGFLGWGHYAYVPHTASTTTFTPGLQRRETWPVDADHEIAQIEGQASQEPEGQPLVRAPSSSNENDNGPDAYDIGREPSATIRVASVDETGTINLEIGFAETEVIPEVSGRDSRHDSATSTLLAISRRPHHVSELSHEPTNMLAILFGRWATSIILMPIRALVLSGLARHVIARPDIYDVDPVRAPIIPTSFRSALGISAFGVGWIDGYGGKVALACMVDASLGLGYWLAEWAMVRWVGKKYFEWGTF